MGFPRGSAVKTPRDNAGDAGLIPGLRRFPGGGNGSPPQCSYLGNPMGRGAYSPRGRKELAMIEHTCSSLLHRASACCFLLFPRPQGLCRKGNRFRRGQGYVTCPWPLSRPRGTRLAAAFSHAPRGPPVSLLSPPGLQAYTYLSN